MKKILKIIILSFIFFSAGSIFGTGGLGIKSTVDSWQAKTIEVAYTSVTDVWKTFKQVKFFVMESQENMEATFIQFRDDQVKIAVAGLINYKNATKSQPDVSPADTESVLEVDDSTIPVAKPIKELLKQEPILKTSGSTESTTSTSNELQEDYPLLNRNTDVMDKMFD